MNETSQIYFLILLGLAFVLIALLSGLVAYLLLRGRKKEDTQAVELDSSIDPTIAFCNNHEKEPGKGTCSICERNYCEVCLKEYDGLSFCSEHLRTFSENKWIDITSIKTTPNNPEAAMFVYQFKKEQWGSFNIPSYIVTHYKINIDGDHIESYVMLYVRSQDEEVLKGKLNQIN